MALTILRYPFEVDFPRRRSMRRTQTETEDEYIFHVVMPGVSRDSVKVELLRKKLKIVATRKDGEVATEWIALPKYSDRAEIQASARDGVLTIKIQKKHKEPTRDIVIAESIDSDDNAYVLDLAVPGAAKKDLRVTVANKRLTVNAEGGDMGIFDDFRRTFSAPTDADLGKTRASCKDGLLLIQIPKLEEVTIPVEQGNATQSDELCVTHFSLPGVSADKIDVRRVGRRVSVEARESESQTRDNYYSDYISELKESMMLPDFVDVEKTRAVAENGVLAIVAPIAESERPREILVQNES